MEGSAGRVATPAQQRLSPCKLDRNSALPAEESMMGTAPGPDSAYTRTWSPSGEIDSFKLVDGTRLRYLKAGSGPTSVIMLHTVRTQLDHFQLVIPKIVHAFTVYALDL